MCAFFHFQQLENGFSIFSSQGISSSLISFEMIFDALQSELLSYSDLSFIDSIKKPKIPGIQPSHSSFPIGQRNALG